MYTKTISGMLRMCLLLVLVVGLMRLPTAVMGACSRFNPGDCLKPVVAPVVTIVEEVTELGKDLVTDPAKTFETFQNTLDNLNRNVEIVGDCLEDAKGCVVKIAKDAVDEAVDGTRSAYGDIINAVGEITNIEELQTLAECVEKIGDQKCPTDDVKGKFSEGGWTTYYGKRIWDSSVAGTVALAIFPGTQAAAVEQFYSMFESQMNSVIGVLEDIASDIGGNALDIAYDIVKTLIDGGDFDDIFGDVGIKAALLRFNCKNDWCVGTANGDSFYQLGFGWRYKRDGIQEMPSIDSIMTDPNQLFPDNPEKQIGGESQEVEIGPNIGVIPNVGLDPNFVDSSYECSCRDACQTYPATPYSQGTPDVCCLVGGSGLIDS